MTDTETSYSKSGKWEAEILLFVVTFLVLVIIAAPVLALRSFRRNAEGYTAERARNLAFAAFRYANDHGQVYPFGTTSTEIFQKLYDGKYLAEPSDVFMTSNGNKTMYKGPVPVALKPQNVTWDFLTRDRTGLTTGDPADLPLVFTEVDTAPDWAPGVNNATITSTNPWGTDGVTMCTLGQQAFFVRPGSSWSATVPLTQPTFTPPAGVKYVTRKP